jgi:D-galactarolactone isomerase
MFPFPFSAGEAVARVGLPPGACDCHVHVYDRSYPAAADAALLPADASIAQYGQVQRRMGTTRAVLVTPSTYGTDNGAMLDGLAQLGSAARGVAVISGREDDAELERLHAAGVRGVRINLSLSRAFGPQDIAPIAQRIAPLGWYLQLLMPPALLCELAPVLRALPVQLVFDHFARLSPATFAQDPAHALLLDLLRTERAWIKLSGGYLVSAQHSVEDPALDALARSFLDAAPQRVLWGSDWPHATASAGREPMPDDARQVDRLAHWTRDAATLRALLVTNPERLYGFAPLSP